MIYLISYYHKDCNSRKHMLYIKTFLKFFIIEKKINNLCLNNLIKILKFKINKNRFIIYSSNVETYKFVIKKI